MTADEKPGGELGPEHGALGYALRLALAGYRRGMDRELAAAGFADRRFPDGRVLRMCSGPGETTISDVGRGLGISRQAASKIAAGLRQRGYLEVTPSPSDGREKILTLTARATQFLAARREGARAIEARLRDAIGADGVQRLFELLAALAGEDPTSQGDPLGDTPAVRALRWRNGDDALS